MASPDTPADRALVAVAVEHQQAKIDRAIEEMQDNLDAYGNDSASRYAEQLRAHNERMRQMEEQNRAYLTSFYDDGDEGSRTDVAGGRSDRSGPSPASGQGSRQPNHAAELTADDIKAMSLDEYTALRARIGMGNASGRGLFGQ